LIARARLYRDRSSGSIALLPVLLCLVLFASALPASAQELIGTYASEKHPFRLVKLVEGLEHPWGLAFLPDGRMLVTERPGRLRIIADGRLDPDPVSRTPAVKDSGQGGLLDVVPHPQFADNQLIYLTYASPGDGGAATAVARGRLVGNRLENVEEIYVALPRDSGGRHFGSRLLFRDGYLFLTAGERGDPDRAQELSDPAGSIIRLHEDGSVPTDNPFVADPEARPEIYAFGNRNPQGMTLEPATGRIYAVEHGPKGGDELNLIEPGTNYGWPVITYGRSYAGFKIGDGVEKEGMAQPVHYWVPSISPSGLLIYDGDHFPAWRGSFFIGALSAELLTRLEVTDGWTVAEERLLEDLEERIRDVRQGPDGLIYLLTDHSDGMLLRIEPLEQ
jgi:glucose/arabinose dehydrogenase